MLWVLNFEPWWYHGYSRELEMQHCSWMWIVGIIMSCGQHNPNLPFLLIEAKLSRCTFTFKWDYLKQNTSLNWTSFCYAFLCYELISLAVNFRVLHTIPKRISYMLQTLRTTHCGKYFHWLQLVHSASFFGVGHWVSGNMDLLAIFSWII